MSGLRIWMGQWWLPIALVPSDLIIYLNLLDWPSSNLKYQWKIEKMVMPKLEKKQTSGQILSISIIGFLLRMPQKLFNNLPVRYKN